MLSFKRIVFGSVIFGAGALAGVLSTKRFFGDRYREDVADIQDFYTQKLDELGVMEADFELPEGHDEEDDGDYDGDYEEDEEEFEDALTKYRTRRPMVDYTKPSLSEMAKNLNVEGMSIVASANGDENLGEIDDEEEDEYVPSDDPEYEAEIDRMAEEFARRRTENMENSEPYLIEPEEYHDCPEDYEQQALYYYAEDRVLCEDDDSQVDDEEECVGFDYEDKLDMQTTCWVRNDRLKMLYEIHRIDDSYKKAIIGLVETPREREFRVQGRRKQALDDR